MTAEQVDAVVEAISRGDPGLGRWAGVAADFLTAGEGADMISQAGLQDFLWYHLPRKSPEEDWLPTVEGAVRLLERLGLARYASIAGSATTRDILEAWEADPGEGFRRFRAARDASGIEPPDTDALAWGTYMGLWEASAREYVSRRLEAAIVAGELDPGRSGWRLAAVRVTEVALAEAAPDDASAAIRGTWRSTVLSERIDSWVTGSRTAQLRMWRARAAASFPPEPPAPPLPQVETATASLVWLLEACRVGVRATQAGYLPPSLARDGAARFGWWPFDGQPRAELDVYQSIMLREMATRERWLGKRSGRFRTTRLGLRLLADPVERWRAVASAIGRQDQFSSALGELVVHRLLEGPAETHPVDGPNDLVDAAAPVILAQGWHSGDRPLDLRDVRRALHEPLREWRLFGLLDEEEPRWVDGRPQGRWMASLTGLGRAAALAHLYARATEPRRELTR